MSAEPIEFLNIRRKPEPDYEKLIKVIQNRNGARVPREEREEALLNLIKRFQYLIRKTARDTFEIYAKKCGERWENWEHDTMTTFLELVVDDYIPIEYGGQAAFGPYIQTKLYFRMKYAGQKLEKHLERYALADFSIIEIADLGTIGQNKFKNEIREAIYAQMTDSSEEVLDELSDTQIKGLLAKIVLIAKEVLDERELFVWNAYFFSPVAVRDIGGQLNPQISTSRVNQIVQAARKKVFEELGKRQILETLKR